MSPSWLQIALRSFLLPLFLGTALLSRADNREQLLRLGDNAYARRAFDSAIIYYERAASRTSPDALVLYKLGNAHYRLRHIAEAMLSYQRALLRRPGFAPAARNAHIIQAQLSSGGDKEVFFIRWWRGLTAPELSDGWAIAAILIFAALLGMLAWQYYKNKKLPWMRPQVIGGALLFAFMFVAFSLAGVWRDVPRAAAVVMRPDTKFASIASGGKGALALPEGLLLRVLHTKGTSVTVALPDGQEGLVQRSDIALVE